MAWRNRIRSAAVNLMVIAHGEPYPLHTQNNPLTYLEKENGEFKQMLADSLLKIRVLEGVNAKKG